MKTKLTLLALAAATAEVKAMATALTEAGKAKGYEEQA